MKDSDAIVGWVEADGSEPYVSDRSMLDPIPHLSNPPGAVPLDASQDVQLVSGERLANGGAVLVFTRKLTVSVKYILCAKRVISILV